MIGVLEVYVSPPTSWERKRCEWLGHHSYRCAHCRKHFIRVKSATEYPSSCAGCGATVHVVKGE